MVQLLAQLSARLILFEVWFNRKLYPAVWWRKKKKKSFGVLSCCNITFLGFFILTSLWFAHLWSIRRLLLFNFYLNHYLSNTTDKAMWLLVVYRILWTQDICLEADKRWLIIKCVRNVSRSVSSHFYRLSPHPCLNTLLNGISGIIDGVNET